MDENSLAQLYDDYNDGINVLEGESVTDYITRMGGVNYNSKADGGIMVAIENFNQGGMAGNKTYHQFHDQYVPMDEESMGYAYGGGVGSMMQPRQNYLIGGEVEENIDFSNMGLQNIINSDLPQNTQVAGGYDSPNEGAYGFNLIELDRLKDAGYDPAEVSGYENKEDVQNLIRSLEPTARLSYDKLNNGTMTDANTSLFNQENVITPMSKPVTGITDRNRGQIIERNPSAPFDRGITMADIAGPSTIDRFSNSTGPVPNVEATYEDMIMNPEGFPNALQNLERFQNNRFSDLDFQPGYDFIDAPNKTNTLSDLYQNRNYIDNPRTGFFDKNIMSKGNPGASLMNKTKSGIGSIMDFMGKIPTPMNLVKDIFNRNPNAPSYKTYSPNIDYSKLNTTNLNDFYDDNPESDTYGTTRFDRAKTWFVCIF